MTAQPSLNLDQSRRITAAPQVRKAKAFQAVGSPEWFDSMVKLAALEPGELVSIKVMITPDFAKWMLDNRNNCPPDFTNRAFSEGHADNWAQRIKNGAYRFSSQGISVCAEGYINNGQHRLGGIYRSGISLPVYMTFGEDRAAFAILDATRVRSRRDVLGQMNKANVNALSAGAGLLYNLERGALTSNDPLLNENLEYFLDSHPGLDAAVEDALPLKRMGASVASAVAAIYLIKTTTKKPATRVGEFLKLVTDEDAEGFRGIIKFLRAGIMQKKLDTHVRAAGYKAPVQAAAIIIAWNLWNKNVVGEPGRLRWQPSEKVDDKRIPFPVAV